MSINTEFNKIPVEYNGHSYIAEFDTSTIMKWEETGVLEKKDYPIEFTFLTFYASLLKNHPHVNLKKLRALFDEIITDDEYGIEAFDDIIEEATRIYSLLFTSRGEKKTKKFQINSPLPKS